MYIDRERYISYTEKKGSGFVFFRKVAVYLQAQDIHLTSNAAVCKTTLKTSDAGFV
jgi:hypothetical protein